MEICWTDSGHPRSLDDSPGRSLCHSRGEPRGPSLQLAVQGLTQGQRGSQSPSPASATYLGPTAPSPGFSSVPPVGNTAKSPGPALTSAEPRPQATPDSATEWERSQSTQAPRGACWESGRSGDATGRMQGLPRLRTTAPPVVARVLQASVGVSQNQEELREAASCVSRCHKTNQISQGLWVSRNTGLSMLKPGQ